MKKGQGFARRVHSRRHLKQFRPLLEPLPGPPSTPSPQQKGGAPLAKPTTDPELAAAEGLFSGQPLESKVPFTPTQPGKSRKKPPSPQPPRGPLLWQKALRPSDVQSQSGHPTGGVRLTQARWEVAGRRIDHTTYFRQQVFAHAAWHIKTSQPLVEEAVVPFHVTIANRNFGIQQLSVSHKPTGEAGQRNYTTLLHWKHLANTVKALNLAGKWIYLYGPPAAQKAPFAIEIR